MSIPTETQPKRLRSLALAIATRMDEAAAQQRYWQYSAEERREVERAMRALETSWAALGYRLADTAQSGAIHLDIEVG